MVREMYYAVSVPENETKELYRKAMELYMGEDEFVDVTNPNNLQGFIDVSSLFQLILRSIEKLIVINLVMLERC